MHSFGYNNIKKAEQPLTTAEKALMPVATVMTPAAQAANRSRRRSSGRNHKFIMDASRYRVRRQSASDILAQMEKEDLAEAEKEKIEAIEAMRKKYNRNFDVFEEYAQQNFSPVKKKIRGPRAHALAAEQEAKTQVDPVLARGISGARNRRGSMMSYDQFLKTQVTPEQRLNYHVDKIMGKQAHLGMEQEEKQELVDLMKNAALTFDANRIKVNTVHDTSDIRPSCLPSMVRRFSVPDAARMKEFAAHITKHSRDKLDQQAREEEMAREEEVAAKKAAMPAREAKALASLRKLM